MWKVTDGNPVSAPSPAGTGTALEHGDWFDIMGGNFYANSTDAAAMDFNEEYKYQLGWISNTTPDRVNTLTSGTYYNLKIYRSDNQSTLPDTKLGYLAVTFSKDATFDYWIGYRANFTNATQGAYVKWVPKTHIQTYLIDWVPSTNDPSSGGYLDAPIPIGQTLVDGGISIRPTSVGQDTNGDQWIKVNVTVP